MAMYSTVFALHGIAPEEPLNIGAFTIVRSDGLKDYAETHLGFDEHVMGAHRLKQWDAESVVIHTVDSVALEIDAVASKSEEEVLYFVSILSLCFWIFHDLKHTIQLSHEAFDLRGSQRFTFKAGSQAICDRAEHLGRGYTTLICNPPIEVNALTFQRVTEHPLFKPLFDVLLSDDRSDLRCRLLKSVRSIYFALSSNTNESQLILSIAAIDALLDPPKEELRTSLGKSERANVLVKNHIRVLLGETALVNIIRFRDSWQRHGASPFYAYDQRNLVVHDGELCDYGTVVDGYRLAIRVLLSVAQLASNFESRLDLVSALHSLFATKGMSGRAEHLLVHADIGYPWLVNGMPDFLPFVISRYFGIHRQSDSEKDNQNWHKAIRVLVQQRGLNVDVAYQALQQVSWTSYSMPKETDVMEFYDDDIDLHHIMKHAVFCRQGSPLAWVINEDETWKTAASTMWE